MSFKLDKNNTLLPVCLCHRELTVGRRITRAESRGHVNMSDETKIRNSNGDVRIDRR